jgi:phage gpG-like protein
MLVKISGTKKLIQKLNNCNKLIKGNIIMEALGQKLLNKMQAEYFPKGGTEEGKWQPNTPATIMQKRGGSLPLTGNTSHLRTTLNYIVKGDSKGAMLIMGSPLEYAEFHQQEWEGNTYATPEYIPRRAFFPTKRIIEKEWTQIATKLLKKVIDKA